MPEEQLISEIEGLIRRDPARRGLIGADGNGPGEGELAEASRLFHTASGACLITGFFVPELPDDTAGDKPDSLQFDDNPGNAETDGPPGTIVLADVLSGLGIPVTVITDELCEPVVRAACSAGLNDEITILASPIERIPAADWREETLNRRKLQTLSHLVSIERVGPGHTTTSLQASETGTTAFDDIPDDVNARRLPGHCCNMRGENIDRFSADLHLLVEGVKSQNPAVRTIGVGDGGNEIGMGRFTWSELRERIPGPHADRIPCRISADRTIVAGVSNWGACALAAAIAVRHDRLDLLERHTAQSQRCLIEKIVSDAGAVDGITRRNEATVDGLPFVTQIQPWIAIRKRLGLQP